MKIYIDANCYILYAQEKLPQLQKILDLKIAGKIEIFYQDILMGQLLPKKDIPHEERNKIEELLNDLDYRGAPFTIGESVIEGSGYIPSFSNRKTEDGELTIGELEITAGKKILLNKQKITDGDRIDVELYKEAVNLGCEYFITENTHDFGKANSEKRRRIENLDPRIKQVCKIRTVDEFIKEVIEND